MASQEIYIVIPGSDIKLYPGYKIKLNRFDSDIWTVHYGWYDFSGNRPIMGWYLTNDSDSNSVKPIQKIDLYDIYVVDTSEKSNIDVETIQSDFTETNPIEPSYIKNRPFYANGDYYNLDSRYDECKEYAVEDEQGNKTYVLEFTNVVVDVSDKPKLSIEMTADISGEVGTTVLPIVGRAKFNDVDIFDTDNNIQLFINGTAISGMLTDFSLLQPEKNVITLVFSNTPYSELPSFVKLSIIDGETSTESRYDYLPFTHIKLLDNKFISDKYRYLNYTGDYFEIVAEADENLVTVEIGVPVGVMEASTGTITYTVKDGIRAGDFRFASLSSIYVDMFPKNQEWDIWTLNSIDNGGARYTAATALLIQTQTVDYKEHIKYCTEIYKTYLFRDEHNPLGNLWAGLRWIVVFNSNESAQSFANKLNGDSSVNSITVRLKDVDFVEENIVPILPIPEETQVNPNDI